MMGDNVEGSASIWPVAGPGGYVFSRVLATIGLATRNPEAAQFAAGLAQDEPGR